MDIKEAKRLGIGVVLGEVENGDFVTYEGPISINGWARISVPGYRINLEEVAEGTEDGGVSFITSERVIKFPPKFDGEWPENIDIYDFSLPGGTGVFSKRMQKSKTIAELIAEYEKAQRLIEG